MSLARARDTLAVQAAGGELGYYICLNLSEIISISGFAIEKKHIQILSTFYMRYAIWKVTRERMTHSLNMVG